MSICYVLIIVLGAGTYVINGSRVHFFHSTSFPEDACVSCNPFPNACTQSQSSDGLLGLLRYFIIWDFKKI